MTRSTAEGLSTAAGHSTAPARGGRRRTRWLPALLAAVTAAVAPVGMGAHAVTLRPGATERISVSSAGQQANGASGLGQAQIAVTPDGRYVAFASAASNLVAGDTNAATDVFRRDRRTGKTLMASVPAPGTVAQQAGGAVGVCASTDPAISASGRYVAFTTCRALDGKAPDIGNDVYVHDFVTGATTRVSVSYDGTPLLGRSGQPSISADGRYIAFQSFATGLVREACPGDVVAQELCALVSSRDRVYVRDMVRHTTALVSVSTAGTVGDGDAYNASISSDGGMVVFTSNASNLVSNDHNVCDTGTPSCADVYVRDLRTSVTQLVSVGLDGQSATVVPAFGGGGSGTPASSRMISGDDRYVAFESAGVNLVPSSDQVESGAVPGGYGVYVRDLVAGRTERVSVTSAGAPLHLGLTTANIDETGRYVAFDAVEACGSGATTSSWSVAVHDRLTGETRLLDRVNANDVENPCSVGYTSAAPVVAADGRYVAFVSSATNLVGHDTNNNYDVFVRDRGTALGVGRVVAAGRSTSNIPAGLASLGLQLTEATVAYRPDRSDLFVRLALASMPPLGLGGPSVRYAVEFRSGRGEVYQVRITKMGLTVAVQVFRSTRTGWLRVADVSGGFGTTGLEVVAAVPLRMLGVDSPQGLSGIQARTQLVAPGGVDATTIDALTLA